jgi:hypothetical protein
MDAERKLPNPLPRMLKIKCGCSVDTHKLPVWDKDPQVHHDALAKLVCLIESHLAGCPFAAIKAREENE